MKLQVIFLLLGHGHSQNFVKHTVDLAGSAVIIMQFVLCFLASNVH